MPQLRRLAPALALLALLACKSEPKGPDPESTLRLHREFALRYYDSGEMLRAEQQVDKGLELAPKDPQLLLMKGWIRQRRGTTRDIFVAEAVFRDLVREGDYRAHLGLAQALERKGVLYSEASAAVASGKRATNAPDPQARAQELVGLARDAWKESETWYRKTLAAKPEEFQALNGMQRVQALRGEYEDSLAWARTLLDKSSGEIAFWKTQLGRADLDANDEERLRKLLVSSQRLQQETHMQAAGLLVQLGRREQALEHLEGALALAPEDAEALGRRGQLLYELGRHEEALASLRLFLRHSTEPFEHPDIARAYDMINTCEDALARAAVQAAR